MKKAFSHFFYFIVASFFILNLTSCSSASGIKKRHWPDSGLTDKKFQKFNENVNNYLAESKFQGAVLVGKNGKIIFAKGYGLCDSASADKNQIGINTTFEAGSITKQLTAAAIMQLVEKRKLSVDDKLTKFFPDFEAGNQITIKMLLNMRSGLTDHINSADEFFPKNIYRRIEVNQMACKPVDENLVLVYLNDAPLLAEPDSTYFYCNTNYYLLARIIELVSGDSYYDYIRKNIFETCGMTSSNLEFQKTDTKGYDYKNRYYSIPAALSLGCGDLNSSVVDLFRWNTFFTNGKIVRKKTFKKMIDSDSYGYGVYCHDGSIFHAGVTNVFNSYDGYYFDEKLSIIVLSNSPAARLNTTTVARNIYKLWSEK